MKIKNTNSNKKIIYNVLKKIILCSNLRNFMIKSILKTVHTDITGFGTYLGNFASFVKTFVPFVVKSILKTLHTVDTIAFVQQIYFIKHSSPLPCGEGQVVGSSQIIANVYIFKTNTTHSLQ